MEIKYRPEFVVTKKEVDNLIAKGDLTYVDALRNQIFELFEIRNPERVGLKEDEVSRLEEFLSFEKSIQNSITYVYFPWNRHIVKTVNHDLFQELRTNRNQDLITKAEQSILHNYKVVVLGLSVGSSVALSLTQAGISNEITLMDPDTLDTTNLNRIMAGVHQVGLNKAVVSARKIYEENPFANVNIDTRGMSENRLEKLIIDGKVDCIVEEMDSIKLKVKTRFIAAKYKLPVVMVTDNGDGVVLHVERYDLGHDRIFNKNFTYWEELLSNDLSSKKASGNIIIESMVGGIDRVDERMVKSVKKVLENKLVSWSQLGSAALLGGVVSTYFIKQIALDLNKDIDIRGYIAPNEVSFGTHIT